MQHTAESAYLSAFEDQELNQLSIYQVILEEFEKGLLEATLHRCGYNQAWTADVLGMARNTLRKKIKMLGLPSSP